MLKNKIFKEWDISGNKIVVLTIDMQSMCESLGAKQNNGVY